eukprot:TRINITY_DN4583_c0_g1_i4.p1 TRINITY_DN4583_c0_g1~~TRINITY_DN4583_c0_g1_i4.p1  ORF type:complete len:323 (-),score=112.68 TRINITY_DN4583_c0_g1_i4:166-1134(-)
MCIRDRADMFHRYLKQKKLEKYTFRTNFKPLEKFIKEQEEKGYDPFDLGVIASFPKVIPNSILNLFPKGVIVVHPSLVPNYLGGSPIEHQILNSETKGGVSILEASRDKPDRGKVLLMKECRIGATDDYLELSNKCGRLGGEALVEVLGNLEEFLANAQDQPASDNAIRAPTIEKEDAIFLWDKLTMEKAVRKQMALYGSNMPGFTKFKRNNAWQYVYFDHLKPENDESSEYYKKILAPVEGKAVPGDIHWKKRGENTKLSIRCTDGWVSTERIKVEHERANSIGNFIEEQLRKEHFEIEGKFVHKFADSKDIVEYERKVNI